MTSYTAGRAGTQLSQEPARAAGDGKTRGTIFSLSPMIGAAPSASPYTARDMPGPDDASCPGQERLAKAADPLTQKSRENLAHVA